MLDVGVKRRAEEYNCKGVDSIAGLNDNANRRASLANICSRPKSCAVYLKHGLDEFIINDYTNAVYLTYQPLQHFYGYNAL